jgi:hypothetical protein
MPLPFTSDSEPSSVASGAPQTKTAPHNLKYSGLPSSASSTSFWFNARKAARRTLTLSKGG